MLSRAVDTWSDAEFLRYSGEHLAYEVMMFLVARNVVAPMESTLTDVLLHNALVEMRGLHARCLIDFFYDRNPRGTDVIAADFFSPSNGWRQIRPPLSATLQAVKRRADREIAHLTTHRIYGTPREKEWPEAAFAELDSILHLFADHAPKARLHSEVQRLLAEPASALPHARVG